MVFLHDFGREGQHLERRFRVKSGGVLVQQQELGLVHGRHQQGQRLALTAGQQTHAGGQAVFQAQVQALEQFAVALPLGLGDANPQAAPLAAPGGQGEVLFDLHGGGRAGHGVLKNTADVGGALVLAQFGDVDAVDQNLALVYGPDTGHRVQHGGFARTVAADDGNEVALVQLQVQPVQGRFLIDRACIEGLGDILDLKHFSHPPSFLQSALRSTGSSSKAPPGRWPPRRR